MLPEFLQFLMFPGFLQLFEADFQKFLEATTLLKRLVAPPVDPPPLLAALLPHTGSTILGPRIKHVTFAARGERGMTRNVMESLTVSSTVGLSGTG